MPTIISLDPSQRLLEPGTHCPLPQPAPTTALGLELLEPAHSRVLHAATDQAEPITKGQLVRLSGLTPAEVREATDLLCQRGMLKRLNTLVESFIAAAAMQG